MEKLIRKKKYGIFLLLTLISFTPLLWFKNGLLIAGGDQSLFLNPGFYLDKLFLWSDYLNGGGPSPFINIFSPFLTLYKLVEILKGSAQLFQKVWFVFSYLLALVSMRYLYNTVGDRRDSVGTLVAVCFYVFNLYTLIISPFVFQYWVIYAAFPLTFTLFIKGLHHPISSGKYIALGGLSSLLYSATNPALFLVSFIPLVSYLLYYLILRTERRFKQSLFFSLKFFSSIILLNLWAFYPSFYTLLLYMRTTTASQGGTGLWATTSTQVYEAIRLLGQWCWSLSHLYKYYDNSLFIYLSYLFPFFIVAILLFRLKDSKILFFPLLAIIGIFLTKGVNPPLGFIYKYAYLKIPGFTAFREPFTKFTFITAISYAVIIGFVIDKLWSILTTKGSRDVPCRWFIQELFLIFVFSIILINVWPTFTNNFIRPGDKKEKSFHVKVPNYWGEANRWLHSFKEHFSLLELPKDSGYGTYFNWRYGYDGINPSVFLLDVPIWGHSCFSNNYSDRLVDLIYDGLYEYKTDKLSILLGMMNIKYIHLRTDMDWKSTKLTSPAFNRDALSFQKFIRLERRFGKKEFYENDKFLPLIYAAHNLKIIDRDPWSYNNLEFLDALEDKDYVALIFQGQYNDKLLFQKINYHYKQGKLNDPPKINFTRVNPTKYIINITSNFPFCLVFSQSYHPNWVAYIQNEKVKFHFVVNGFANGYFVDKTGKFSIVLEFIPQRLEILFIFIAMSSIVFLLIKLLLGKKKIERDNYRYVFKN